MTRPNAAPPSASRANTPAHLTGGDLAAARDREHGGEDDDADPVVEQRLAGDPGLELVRRMADLRTPSTAIGSVGEIRAPNSSASIGAIATPIARRASWTAPPIRIVDNSVPPIASAATASLSTPRLGDVEVQRAREQQEAEHAVEQRVAEVELGDQATGLVADVDAEAGPARAATASRSGRSP